MKESHFDYNQATFKPISELFEEKVSLYPSRTAIYLDSKNISYFELNARVNQLAWYLKDIGIQPNTIVGIDMERSYEMIVAIFAIFKAGGAYLPMDSNYPLARKQQIINDSQMRFLIVNNEESCLDFGPNCQIIKYSQINLLTKSVNNLAKVNSPYDLAYVIYTSGSTGRPKGVLIQHYALANRIEWMQKKFPLQPEDVILQKTHYCFDVSVWEITWWSIAGAGLKLLPPAKEYDVRLIAKLIERNKVSIIHFVPSVLRIFLNYVETDFDLTKLNSLKYVFSSGEELDIHTVERFNRIFKDTELPLLINLYGPTEATIDVSYFICHKNRSYQYIPIGRPIDNIQLFVLDDQLQLLATDYAGELYISGVGLSVGYLNKPELTTKAFIPNPHLPGKLMYKTGDIAKWDRFSELIFLGRKDDQIKLRGLRIELSEIQYHLLQHPDISNAHVLFIVEDNYEQTLVAFIVSKCSELPNRQGELRNYLLDKLPKYMIPTYFIFLENLPLTRSGKVNKEELKSIFTLNLEQNNMLVTTF